MSFRSLASLRVAVSFAALLVLSACSDNRQAQLSAVETIEVPAADAGPQANQNIANPTLEIPVTYAVEDGDELTLVWSDEFDGPEIDPEVWFFATGDGAEKGLPRGWGNEELQYYLPDNAMIVNGVLEITARRETVGDFNYTSARINTEDRFAFKYGRIEASIKMPTGQGLLPAFWMLSQSEDLSKNSDYTCGGDECIWAAIGEIDIVEAANPGGTGGNDILGTLHYGGEFPGNTSTTTYYTPSEDITETFNTYALEWDDDEIRWYFNGELYATQPEEVWSSTADNGGPGAPFNQPFHILLNVAVGHASLTGPPNGTTPWPVTMEVDWVRVYSGEPPPAGAGDVPENAVFVTDQNVTADLAAVLDNFGSGATFNELYAGDPDFKPTLQVISGNSYEGNPDVGFVAFTGYDAGFAADFETLSFKVKGLPGDELEVKFFGSPEMSLIINLSTYQGASDLGNGWYQVTIPMSDFAANVYAFTGFLIGPPGDQGAPFSFLLTDIGFNGSIVTAPADPGTTPDVTLYARGAATDLVFGEDYTAIEVFGSGAFANNNNNGDVDFSPAFSVSTGFLYDKWNAQLAFVGFAAGFASSYETLYFKVKGMAGDTIRIKLLNDPNPDYVDIALTSSSYATSLGNGWYQVAVPVADFPGDVATASGLLFETIEPAPDASFTFLLNDIGFSEFVTADPGTTPEFVLFGTTAAADVAIPADGPQNFGSGASFDFEFADTSFDPVIAVTAGNGYSGVDNPENWVAFLAVINYASPIAVGYDTFNVKVKGSPDGRVEVKLIGAPGEPPTDSIAEVNVATYAGSTDLGDGWYQLEIPFTEFSKPENIPNHTGWLIGPPGDQGDAAFVFLLTDVGFSNVGGATADPGTTPEFVLFGTTAAADVAIPADGPQNFGSGASFDFEFADTSFDPVIAVTAGNGYSGVDNPENWVAFLAVINYASPIAVGYDTFNVKVKGSPDGRVEVKLIGAPGEPPTDSIAEVNVATYAGSTDLGDGWYQLEIPFTEFSKPENIPNHTGWLIGPPGDQGDAAFVFLLTDVGFSNAGGGTGLELLTNGDFEVGDTSGWESGGAGSFSFSATMDQATGPGEWSGNLSAAGGGSNILIKQANLAAGTVAPNQPINVSLDYCGSNTGIGGVIKLELLSEFGGDGGASRDELGQLTLTSTWQAVTFNSITGDNVAGGVTLQIIADCGGNADCAIDAYLDNISVTLDDNVGNVSGAGGACSGSDGGGGTGGTGDELVVNGDFETGEFGGWTTSGIGASTTIFSPGSGSTFAASINSSGSPGNATLKQANLGAGQLSPNQIVTVSFDYRGAAATGGVINVNLFSEGSSGVSQKVELLGPGDTIPPEWTAFGPFGVDVGSDVSGGLTLEVAVTCGAEASCEASLFLDNVSITIGGDAGGGGGTGGGGGGGGGTGVDIAINGGFETGAFNDGTLNASWQQFPNGGVQTITTDNPSEGIYAANLNVPVRGPTDGPVDNLLKNANLEAGNLTPGASITVTWDMRGSLQGAGGVVFVELFSEFAGGGATGEIYTGGPIFPDDPDVWTSYTWTTTLGADVSGGVTLQLKASCGPVEGCGVDAYFDNITIVTAVSADTGGGDTGGGDTGGGGTGGGDTVLATFDETTPLVVTAFGGAVSMIETGPAGGDGSIALKIARDNGLNYAGAWVAIPAIPSNAGTQTVSALVYSPTAGIPMAAKAEFGEAAGTGDVQANEAVVVGWQTLTWTFTNLDPGQVYNRFVMLPNLGTVDTAASYYFDNITLLGAGG